MASLKPIVLDKSYIQINRCEIQSADDRFSPLGKALKLSFLQGPAVDSSVITISSKKPDAQKPDAEDQKTDDKENDNKESEDIKSDDSKEQSGSESDSESSEDNSQSDNGNNGESSGQGNSEESHESYSILNAYNKMHLMYEDDEPSGDNSDSSSQSEGDSSSDSSADSKSDDSSDTGDKSDDKSDTGDKDDNKSDEDNEKESNSFHPGNELYVQVLLKGEGCTVWHIQLDRRISSLGKVVNQLASKSFKAAVNEAKKGLKVDGLVPLSATTYLKKDAPAGIPFIGHCQYAMDSGSEHAEDDANNVVIAVAPIDGVTKRPSEKIIYKSVHDINGDFTDGVLPFLADLKNNSTVNDKIKVKDKNGDEEEVTVSKAVSDWLNDNFDCVGNTYDNFKKLRDFVVKQSNDNKLTPNADDSEDPKHFSMISQLKSGKSLIFY